MADQVTFEVNKSQGEEHRLPCISCIGETSHLAVASYDERGDEGPSEYSVSWVTKYQIVQCLGCKSVSFRQAGTNSESYDLTEAGPEYIVTERLYPSRIAGRRGIGDDAYFLPPSVLRIYEETTLALTSQAPILTGIGLRALIESVCKEKAATGRDLLAKIDSLVAANVLTPTSAAILHKIRALGNAAAHEVKPHTERQLALAMDIIEHLLKDVYILPKQAESEFE